MGASRSAWKRARRPHGLIKTFAATFFCLFVMLCALVLSGPSEGAQAADPAAGAGEVLVTDVEAGQVLVVDGDNKKRELTAKLNVPTGVTALVDGSVLIAEGAANRIVGFGGRYALGAPVIDDVAGPLGLATGEDGTVYASTATGVVGRLDLDQRRLVPIAEGLRHPAAIAVRDGYIYAVETTAGTVVQIKIDNGSRTEVAGGFDAPAGVAAGPGKMLFISETKRNRIVKIDDAGARTEFAALEEPQQLTVEPLWPRAGQPYTVTAAYRLGAKRFDQSSLQLFITTMRSARAVAAIPATEVRGGADDDALAQPQLIAQAPAGAGSEDIDFDGGATTSTYALMASIAIIVGAVIAGVVMFVLHRPKSSAEAGFEERPLDDDSVFEAFGPCASQEVELAEAEGALRAVVVQRQTAEQQLSDARRRVERSERTVEQARGEHAKAFRARQLRAQAGEREPVPGLRAEELGLRTTQGRDALAAFRRGEIDSQELEDLWLDLQERDALEYVQIMGVVVASRGQLSFEEVRASRIEERQRKVLATADHDRDHALQEIERLQAREQQARERIAEAWGAVTACHRAHSARTRPGRRSVRRTDVPSPRRPVRGPRPGPARPPEPARRPEPARPPVPVGRAGVRVASPSPSSSPSPRRSAPSSKPEPPARVTSGTGAEWNENEPLSLDVLVQMAKEAATRRRAADDKPVGRPPVPSGRPPSGDGRGAGNGPGAGNGNRSGETPGARNGNPPGNGFGAGGSRGRAPANGGAPTVALGVPHLPEHLAGGRPPGADPRRGGPRNGTPPPR